MARWLHFTVAAICLPCLFATGVNAQSINACMNKRNGALRVVADPAQCKRSESFISWHQTAPAGPQGPVGPPGPQGPPGQIDVYDNNRQYLGIYTGGYFDIYIEGINSIAGIDTATGNLRAIGIHFESNDCTGTPYASDSRVPIIVRAPNSERVFKVHGPYKSFIGRSALGLNGCQKVDGVIPTTMPQATEISWEYIPFEVPIALPISLE